MAVSFVLGSVLTSTVSTSYAPRWVGQTYAVDLDNDGNSDYLVLGASYPSDGEPVAQPSLLAWGTGAGSFTLASQSEFPFATLNSVHPREVAFADFNGDGYKDVFVASHGYDTAPYPGEQNQLFLSNGDGTWRDATANLPAISDFSHSTAVADINGDGALDIVVGNTPEPNPVVPYVLLNDGHGVFTRDTTLLPTGPGGALDTSVRRLTSTGIGDLDDDGRPDLVLGAAFSTTAHPVTMQILWNTGGSFAAAPATDLPFPAFFGQQQLVYDIQAIDVNFDGLDDLVVAYQGEVWLGGWELQVLENQGNRVFVDKTTTYLPDPASRTGGTPSASSAESQYWVQFINVADINADGRLDFTLDARGITTAPSSLPVAFVHQADGSFAAATAGELAGTAPWLFDYTTQFVSWNGGSGFAHFNIYEGTARIEVGPVTFAAVSPLIQGTAGNDRLEGTGADDSIHGGAGRDTAVYTGAVAEYVIARTATGHTAQDMAGGDGTDTLTAIEKLEFSDMTVNLTVQAVAQAMPAADVDRIMELYVAFFNRTPDADGLEYWLGQFAAGTSVNQIAESFYSAGNIYSELTGFSAAMSNEDFVNVVYRNVLGRQDGADAGGLAHWSGLLASGAASRGSLVSTILDSAHTFKGDATWGWVADLLDNKIEVAATLAVDWGLNYNTPQESISKGMEIAAAVTSSSTAAAIAIVGIAEGQIDLV
jgi:hypothetical protein